ncbi:hypothetical protein MAESPC_02241 [Microcystis aeruginosa SPC777]|uniref:Uncharacterized protein n=1 Tax=Microcystis aeruginosa SPC777 TaxID=482300 RepID=S3J853_MICAE|nr:hypothetical protein MAESPC_02241 [Microcystis aeruginosa SPC777]
MWLTKSTLYSLEKLIEWKLGKIQIRNVFGFDSLLAREIN